MAGVEVESTGGTFHLFGAPPGARLLALARMRLPRRLRVLLFVFGVWVPLVILAALDGRLLSGPVPLVNDYAVHARLLVELPLLLVGRRFSQVLFGQAMAYLIATGAIPDDKRDAVGVLVSRLARVRDSLFTVALVVLAAYALTALELDATYGSRDWWKSGAGGIGVSTAGYWYFFVARPVVIAQVLFWLVAFGLWVWLLVGLVRLPLCPMPLHADGAAGLRPIMTAHQTFATLAFALSTDVAGAFANELVHRGASPATYQTALVAFVVVLSIGLVAPLSVVFRVVMPARLQALSEYGKMSFALGRALRERSAEASARGFPDSMCAIVSAHCDAGAGMEIVAKTSPFLLTRRFVLLFVTAAALPIVLALLTRVPVLTVLEQLKALAL